MQNTDFVSFSGKFACKIGIQGFSFALPLNLAVPVTLVFLVSMCGFRDEKTCFWNSFFPSYLYWECPKGDLLKDFIGKEVTIKMLQTTTSELFVVC
jgi:chitin synthase